MDLENLFASDVMILNGELDNDPEHQALNKDPLIQQQQGLHRLERGEKFFKMAEAKAGELKIPFEWSRFIIPQVGHSQTKMGAAAAQLWFEERKAIQAPQLP